MRRTGTAVAALALFGVLSACAGQADEAGEQGQPEGPAPTTDGSSAPIVGSGEADWPAPPEGVDLLAPEQVDATALPEDYPRMVWTEGDGSTVGLYGQEGGCTTVSSELREQTQESVQLTLVEVTTSDGPCTMDLRFPRLSVDLDAPLEDRTVVLERETIGPPRR